MFNANAMVLRGLDVPCLARFVSRIESYRVYYNPWDCRFLGPGLLQAVGETVIMRQWRSKTAPMNSAPA
jgi:hypothetical protein